MYVFRVHDFDVFLSFNWGQDEHSRDNRHRVSVIHHELKMLGYHTWIYEDRISGDINVEVARGIERSKVVMVFLTKKYHEKVNSTTIQFDPLRTEFTLAVRKNKKMIVVVMEKCMRNSSKWERLIGMYLGGRVYIDMSSEFEDKYYLSHKMEILLEELYSMNVVPFHR